MYPLLSRIILFIIYLSSPECRDLASSHLHQLSKEMMGEEVFQLNDATPTYATRPMSLYKVRQETSPQGLCVEVLWPSQPNGVMSSAVSLPNHTFTGQA